ncbi:OLC1v1019475C1 [Oldenlandia corymbosa var. corymbosa]|uniref:Endoglucanase n=1 Tax=Oldenlandia corymbosa var. corymbosa TaxID=529605 RepID=A0AAV1EE71_OLDCO|nr:OLC1v1019475C1 [Oldenlandia corymbosa var. corymbosa]
MSSLTALAVAQILMFFFRIVSPYDYGRALTKSLLYFEAQRSGMLPDDQRVAWRGHSALTDGQSEGVDLVGGYYDAGDHVKFGFPMAYTVTMLAWSVVEFGQELQENDELENALAAIKWGTDYFIKAHYKPNGLYGEVGDGYSDHECWQRAEEMSTPRDAYQIDENNPGSDLVGETAAALAAASMAFNESDPEYAEQLLNHSEMLFEFADKYRGTYQTSIPKAGGFYSSTGYEDELLWAATWIYRVTKDKYYLDYINQLNPGDVRGSFSWDDKYVGAQVLIAQYLPEEELSGLKSLSQYKHFAEGYICNCIQRGENNATMTPGGLLWYHESNNLQYTTSASFIITAYAKALLNATSTIECRGVEVTPEELVDFVKSQVDYILGSNPLNVSYFVGFGSNYPKKIHHRGASIISIKKNSTEVSCKDGFTKWRDRDAPNPNVLVGAIVGGPNPDDSFSDSRDDYNHNEAATTNTAPLVGVLAFLAS